jgi:hypothetical protein
MMDEIVFFHRKSRTAVLANLSENFSNRWLLEHWLPGNAGSRAFPVLQREKGMPLMIGAPLFCDGKCSARPGQRYYPGILPW